MPRGAKKLTLPKGTEVPNHVAIIPDGNRRWARAKGLHTLKGHQKGFNRAVELGRAARELGIHTVTLWGFSTENWDRAKEEINYLMKLYEKLVNDYLEEAKESKVKIIHLGRKDRLPKVLVQKIEKAERETKNNKRHIMNIALDYGGHDDIVRAIQKMIEDKVEKEKVTRELFEKYLDTRNQPYPYVDLIIRTSGEQRTSGFLTWQAHYAETYWETDHFPDFTPEKLREAVLDYSRRRRRFGGNDAVKHLTFKPEAIAKLEVAWWRLEKVPEGTRFRDFVVQYLKEQYGLSKSLAKEAAHHLIAALTEGKKNEWEKAKKPLKKFYVLIKDHLKLAFEPEIVASLKLKLWQEVNGKGDIKRALESEAVARDLFAEEYRISNFQASKAAHLRVLAKVERNLAQEGKGESHWKKAEEYLQKFYQALKDRVA